MPPPKPRKGATEAEEDALAEIPESVAFKIALPSFEGPLDLLLHLIREHRLDIFDIPIALITERYLEYLELMQSLNLDVAGEFLVMAATLAHLKSRLLLPREEAAGQEEEEEQGDPREELVRRLLEHQKYLDAGERLGGRAVLGRDTFARPPAAETAAPPDGPAGLAELSVFDLIGAFAKVLADAKIEIAHEIQIDRISIGEAVARIEESLQGGGRVRFASLLEPYLVAGTIERHRVVVTFLAILEMVKLRLLRVTQDPNGELFMEGRGTDATPGATRETTDDYRG